MTNAQWQKLMQVIDGKTPEPLPAGFIIDSPWLPGWAGISLMDYFSSEKLWLDANLKAVQAFPDAIFLPGFWSEYGMCTEPAAFGTKCIWPENQFPSAEKLITDVSQISALKTPNPRTDGLCPFVLSRLKHCRHDIEKAGHSIKFAISRGPLNIASFLMGTTEFLIALKTDPRQTHRLLDIVTAFIIDWLELQIGTFSSIDGVFILDDIVGFLGKGDFEQFALPYLTKIFQSFNVSVRFFHNDAHGLVCAPYLPQMGINLFNFSFNHTIGQMKELTKNSVVLLGNIPPRQVLADGTAEKVRLSVIEMLKSTPDKCRLIPSCGGGMPCSVPAENITAFISAMDN